MHYFFPNACILILQIWFVVVILIPICHPCDDRKDVKYVESCPKNIDEWNAAAKKKNCAKGKNDCRDTCVSLCKRQISTETSRSLFQSLEITRYDLK